MADDPQNTPTNEPGPGPGEDAVHPRVIVVLAVYLVVLTGLLVWGIYSKWPDCGVVCVDQTATSASPSASPTPTPAPTTQPTETPTPTPTPTQPTPTPTPTPVPGQPPPAQPTAAKVEIESVSPKSGLISCKIQVTVKGKGFKQGANVIFGGLQGTDPFVDPLGQSISVQPPAHAEGDVDLVVKNPDGATSDIAKAAYSYTCPPVLETDLFLLVVFAGALGGVLHGLRSLSWYVGLRNFLKSWILMYVLLPFTGATIAVIFYAVIRAGFLPVQASKNASVATIAIAAIVGLFSQQAAVKLKDIADAFFTKPAPGPPSESKPQGSVPPGGSPESKPGPPKPAISPTSGPAGTPVKIAGTGMKSVKSITFGGNPGTAVAIAADGTITVTPPPPTAGQDPKVEVVVTGDKEPPVKLEFTYK
jgi:hypothetical protein